VSACACLCQFIPLVSNCCWPHGVTLISVTIHIEYQLYLHLLRQHNQFYLINKQLLIPCYLCKSGEIKLNTVVTFAEKYWIFVVACILVWKSWSKWHWNRDYLMGAGPGTKAGSISNFVNIIFSPVGLSCCWQLTQAPARNTNTSSLLSWIPWFSQRFVFRQLTVLCY